MSDWISKKFDEFHGWFIANPGEAAFAAFCLAIFALFVAIAVGLDLNNFKSRKP